LQLVLQLMQIAQQGRPSLYGFVRKEALVSSQIEGTRVTFQDIAAFEATNRSRFLTSLVLR